MVKTDTCQDRETCLKFSVDCSEVLEYLYNFSVEFLNVWQFFNKFSVECCNFDTEDTVGTKLKAGWLRRAHVVTWQSAKFLISWRFLYLFKTDIKICHFMP